MPDLPGIAADSPLHRPLRDVPGIVAHVERQLGKEDIKTVADVLAHLPFRHEDRIRMEGQTFHASETPSCHRVIVMKTGVKFFGPRRGGNFEAVVQHTDANALGQQLTLRWWGMSFMSRVIAEGQELIIHGKIKDWKGRLSMDHPEYEILRGGDDDEAVTIHAGRITPIYRLGGALTQKAVRVAAWHALQVVPEHFIDDLLPQPKADGEFAGWNRSRAIREAHFPTSTESLDTARRYLALEEFYLYQLRVVHRRREVLASGGRSMTGDGSLVDAFIKGLPFALTDAQSRCVKEIKADMASKAPMNRLLHGDVGSGKTVVAFASMLTAVEAGAQAALMAPTQILAEQHARNARKWLEPLGLRVALLTGAKKEDGSGMELWTGDAKPHILIGTHALLHDDRLVHDLGLVVIDEQHKFGVAQRAKLIQQGTAPDVLVMTATPIPRTLTLTIYGDLDVSTIDQRPQTGTKITTAVRSKSKIEDAAKFLREQIEAGRQGYLVYPLIEESDKLDAGAAVKGHKEWGKLLKPHKVGLLHGRMDAEEKDDVMKPFREGDTHALVSTTVIEVGVDVPNATVMYIHDAGRFGLAQLHQLRGRIGRGAHSSYCVLFIDDKDEEAKEHLAIMEETSDGFRIAEEDLRRRGPGNVLGHAQSGQAPLRFAELLADTRLVRTARALAERTFEEDPQLSKPEHLALRPFAFEQREVAKEMMQ
ncbi:MAG: ATP-dependent DNA helicase RecG [Verrucomicrobiaceae bacterium]|nr:ATP-dependent DNA helicase RecG [Verrucomicrobiaceae bacterium]